MSAHVHLCPRTGRAVWLATILALAVDSAVAWPAGLLEPFGLSGREVTSLGTFGWLYAGTIDQGVFRRDLESGDWVSLGLQGKRIRAVYPHASGPLGFATTAGLEWVPLNTDSALVFCLEMDQPPWFASDSGMTRGDIYAVWSLDGFPSPAICGETFAATIGPKGGVWRRQYGSTTWEFVLDLGFGVGNVVRVDPASGGVWAGGETTVLAPWIARSTDAGDTWHVAYPDLAGDNACNAIAIHPDDPDVAYAGMEGPVIKTTDGGVTWQHTGLDSSDAYIYGVALDSSQPRHLLAGGMVRNPNNWALWESFDQGETWSEIPAPMAGAAGISSILADLGRPGVFYISTFGDGVWRYRNVVTGSDSPNPVVGLGLEPGRPNPFDDFTAIHFRVPPALDGVPIEMAVFSVRGERVVVLVDEAGRSGRHRVTWNGRDAGGRRVPPGAYYCRLRAGPQLLTRKLYLLK